MQEITEKICLIVADLLGYGDGAVGPDMTLDELGADSLDVTEVIMGVEDAFNIEIDVNEADMLTPRKLAKAVMDARENAGHE